MGPITLRSPARGVGTPVSADNLIVDADQQSGNATFHNITIGQDAGTLTRPRASPGQPAVSASRRTA